MKKQLILIGLLIAGIIIFYKKDEIAQTIDENYGEQIAEVIDSVTETVNNYKNLLLPRGIRNNNPGNIRLSSEQWQGLDPEQTDVSFFQFLTPTYGVRAMAKILKNYASYGLTSISQIINRWAPANENNTVSYINAVSKSMGKSPFENLIYPDDMTALIAAIIQHENGVQPYDTAILTEGIRLAYV